MGPILQVIGAVAAVGGTIASNQAQRRATGAQKRQQALQVARQRRMAIREAQVKRAQARANAGAFGVGDSAGAFGGIGAVGSQLGAGLGFGTQMTGLSDIITTQSGRANSASGIASLGMTAFNVGASGALDGFSFDGKKSV